MQCIERGLEARAISRIAFGLDACGFIAVKAALQRLLVELVKQSHAPPIRRLQSAARSLKNLQKKRALHDSKTAFRPADLSRVDRLRQASQSTLRDSERAFSVTRGTNSAIASWGTIIGCCIKPQLHLLAFHRSNPHE